MPSRVQEEALRQRAYADELALTNDRSAPARVCVCVLRVLCVEVCAVCCVMSSVSVCVCVCVLCVLCVEECVV